MSSGATSAADAAPAEPLQPLSVRLIGRGSMLGALVVLAIAMTYTVALPRLADAVAAPAAARIVALGDGATVRVTDDWSVVEDSVGAVTLTQGGARLIIAPPQASDLHPAQSLDAAVQAWIAEGQGGDVVAPAPRAFTTDAGDDAATVALQDPLRSGQAWVVSNGTHQVVALLSAPQQGWETASASAQLILRSLQFAEDSR